MVDSYRALDSCMNSRGYRPTEARQGRRRSAARQPGRPRSPRPPAARPCQGSPASSSASRQACASSHCCSLNTCKPASRSVAVTPWPGWRCPWKRPSYVGAAAGRTALLEHGDADALASRGIQRHAGALHEGRGDVLAVDRDHAGAAGHGGGIGARLDLGGRPGNGHAAGDLGTDGRRGPRRASAPARMIDGHTAAVVAHGLPSRQELTRTYCMKGTGTAAGNGAFAPRPPQTLDDRPGAVNASRHGRTAATAANRHLAALCDHFPRPRRHRFGRLLRILRLDPGPQRRITQLQYLEQAQRAQGGQGLRNVAPAASRRSRVAAASHQARAFARNAPTVPLRTITPWNSPWFTSSGNTSCAFMSAPCRAGPP